MSRELWDGTTQSCCGSWGARESAWGCLCLADIEREISETERRLLEALAGHASVALENVRLFSRIERSRKQWVEDIDAISDFIVVHDKGGRVLRLNRVLADLLGTHPAESVGKDVGKLGLLDSPIHPGRCPFCRRSEAAHEEFVHTAGDRTYLISASRIHGEEREKCARFMSSRTSPTGAKPSAVTAANAISIAIS